MKYGVLPSLLVVSLLSATAFGEEGDAAGDLAARGYAVLEQYCLRCHGDDFKYPGLDMRDRELLLRPKDADEEPFLVVGKPDESRLWQMIDGGGMPPEDQPQPTDEEKQTLKEWIESGVEFPLAARQERKFIGERTLLSQIAADLQKQPATSRHHLRYFSLAHLWNAPQVSDEHLRIVRAAVSKLLNGLSSQPRIAPPAMVGADGVLLRIDLRDYGWEDSRQWQSLIRAYPYGLHVSSPDAEEVYEATFCDLPYVRADWFVYHAARPPLYHELVTLPEFVGIPERQQVLEKLLSVDLESNYELDRLWRAGFSGEKSGVSDHNRIVERHDARYGYYWPSYDSAGDIDRQNFFNFPLGPKFADTTTRGAFSHDGGEIIFSLPNGLQAYMLAKADGTRLEVGPQAIVRDPQQFSGSYDIVNGISCMGCHRHGMLSFEDTIRPLYEDRTGEIAEKVRRLYPKQKEMDELVDRDRRRFLTALEEAIGRFLRSGSDDERNIRDFPEPVTTTAKQYEKRLRADDVARELGLPERAEDAKPHGIKATAGELTTVIKFSDSLRRLELLPLTAAETITRPQWEKAFQPAARELGIGIPVDFD